MWGQGATEPPPFVLDGRQWHVTAGTTPMLVLSFADLWMDAPAERGRGRERRREMGMFVCCCGAIVAITARMWGVWGTLGVGGVTHARVG